MTEETPAGEQPWIRRKLYGRRKGKALKPSQERLIGELLPRVNIPGVAGPEDPDRHPVDLTALFGDARPVWLEIGFGGGEHLAHQASKNPDVGMIGCEPYVNGVAKLLAKIDAQGLSNVRVHPSDARDMIELLPQNSLDRVFVLYPDPWPKSRHAGRRFINPGNLDGLQRVMKPGTHLRLATDIPQYVEHALEVVEAHEAFDIATPKKPDWSVAWSDWPGTRYEAKALAAGRSPHYLTFIRK
ncbi:tRNA (guanosine(46)-N7)-methyltransferase TrmB [Amaricoccus tamworthensis]|uniref:tRNA (guanosine(46)-N7)-methyltransferase TrmB n=1 Tax=Amaricoccus tamworthensis TaxID=57002 RepID=UPI003C7D164C